MTTADLLADLLDETRRWTLMLLEDLQGDDWGFQPAPGMGHALWLCGHLAAAQNVLIFKRCLGREELNAEFESHFPMGQPVKALGEHPFPAPAEVLKVMSDFHARALRAVHGMSESLLAEPAYAKDGGSPHPHYRDKRGAVAHAARHEAFHAGQIASIRRLRGKPFLR
jgi:hypothetical protein